MDNIKKNANGQDAIIYNAETGTPWHQKGTPVNGPMTLEVAETIFPFHYYKEAILRPDGTPITTHDSIVISDTNSIMGVGGVERTIIQPKEVCEFAADLFDAGQMKVATAGALGLGQKLWILCHAPNYEYEPVKGLTHRQYVCVANAYDDSMSLISLYTDVCVVCQNTLNEAISGSPCVIKLRHTANVKQRMAMATEVFKGYVRANADFQSAMVELGKHPITDELLLEFERSMFGDLEKTEEGRSRSILQNKIDAFKKCTFAGKCATAVPGVSDTLYGMLQGYTEWSDFYSTVKGQKDKDGVTDRTNAILFGQASKDKVKALNLALVLAGR
jgi:phage/plasmid-like protein (TIGR03299 family)